FFTKECIMHLFCNQERPMSTVIDSPSSNTAQAANAPAQSDVGNKPAEGVITDAAIAAARDMIGLHLRPEGPYLQDASADTLRNWCNGIGDLNPLYRELGYGAGTRYGSMLAHPMFPMAF